MVKTAGFKSSHAVKLPKPSFSAPSGTAVGDAASYVDGVESLPPIDSDEEEYGDCSPVGVDSSLFDSRVDRCFMISDIGAVRLVPVAGVNKEVYNVSIQDRFYQSEIRTYKTFSFRFSQKTRNE